MPSISLRKSNLTSSVLFLVGSFIWTISYFLTFPGVNALVFPIFTYSALACLLMHAIAEIRIDCIFTRTEVHGRYGAQTSVNMMHSLLFGTAVILEGTYFYLFMADIASGDVDFHQEYLIISLVAAHFWFLTAIFTFVGRGCFISGAGLDNNGNVFYTLGAILMLVSSYYLFFFPNEFLSYFVKWAALMLWAVAGMLHCIRDSLNLNSGRPSKSSDASDDLLDRGEA